MQMEQLKRIMSFSPIDNPSIHSIKMGYMLCSKNRPFPSFSSCSFHSTKASLSITETGMYAWTSSHSPDECTPEFPNGPLHWDLIFYPKHSTCEPLSSLSGLLSYPWLVPTLICTRFPCASSIDVFVSVFFSLFFCFQFTFARCHTDSQNFARSCSN